MAITVAWADHVIEVGTRCAQRYLLLSVHSWISVDGQVVAEETFTSADGQTMSGSFRDADGRERLVCVEHGRSTGWRMPYRLYVDGDEIASGETNLGKGGVLAMRAIALIVVVTALSLCAIWVLTSLLTPGS